MKNTFKYAFLLVLLGVLVLGGCVEENNLTPREGSGFLTIDLDWNGDNRPQKASFYIFDQDGNPIEKGTGVVDQYKVSLQPGQYRVLVHNENMINASVRNIDSYSNAEIYVHDADGTRTPANLLAQPDVVYVANNCDGQEVISFIGSNETVYTTKPVQLIKAVTMRVITTSAANIESISGFLNGVSGSVYMATGQPNTDINFSLAYDAIEDPDNGGQFLIKVNLLGFLAQSEEGSTTIDITLTDSNGATYDVSEDISDVIREIINDNSGVLPLEVPIRIDISFSSIDLPEVTVKPWDDGADGEIEIKDPI